MPSLFAVAAGAIIGNKILDSGKSSGSHIAATEPQKQPTPVSVASPEVFQEKRQTQKNLKARRGIGATIIAGGSPGLGAGKQLLGGGS